MDIKDFIDHLNGQIGAGDTEASEQRELFSMPQTEVKQAALALCVMTSQLHHMAVTMLTSCENNPLIVRTMHSPAKNLYYEVRDAFDEVLNLSNSRQEASNTETEQKL